MIKNCLYCGEEFEVNGRGKTRGYCSEECRKVALKEYHKEYVKTYVKPTTPRKKKPKPIPYCKIKQICVVCQEEFYPKNGNQICCSEECSIERAKQLGAERRKYHKQKKQTANGAWHRPVIIEPQQTCEKKGIEYHQLSSEQKLFYGATQLKAYADEFKVFIPKGLKSVNDRKRESI